MTLVTYIDSLQRANAEDLAFYPLSTLTEALERGLVITCEENGEPAGYLWHGPIRGGFDVTIYQACIDYDARRHYLGMGMLKNLISVATAGGATGIRLKCASSAESNLFWQAAGFTCTRVTPGGKKRQRDINHYRTDIQPGLFTFEPVVPSAKQTDKREYDRNRKAGVQYASRFSRTHYGGNVSEKA